jgi:protein PhnA
LASKGRDKHEARQAAVADLGKELARRGRSRCELCEGRDGVRTHDTAPDEAPSLDTLLLLCERCRAWVGGEAQDPRTLRFLETAVWSEVPVVAGLAREMLDRVDADWARETREMLG